MKQLVYYNETDIVMCVYAKFAYTLPTHLAYTPQQSNY